MNIDLFNDLISQGIALMAEQNFDSAKKTFEKAIQIDMKSYDAYVHLGNAAANLGQYDDALSAFRNALILNPESGEINFSMGSIFLLKEDKLKAVEYYNKAEALGFKNADMYQILASIFFEANDTSQALRNINRAISVSPFDGKLRLFKIRIYLSENKYHEALDALGDFQIVLPDAFEVYDLKSQIFCGMKKYFEAIEICNEGINRFPNDANLAFVKLRVLVEMNNDEEAFNLLANMKNNDMFDAVIKEATIQESILIIRSGDVKRALACLSHANNVLGDDADILYLMLDIYGKTGDYEKTLEVASQLVKLDSSEFYSSTAKYFHAYSLNKLGKVEESKTAFKNLTIQLRKATINNPAFYEGYIYRLLSHTKIEEYDMALELADYLENMYPERADAHAFRYLIYKEQGNIVEAEREKSLAQNFNSNFNL